jgi:6-pyruvoyltetrahydropterin/6-carboxytetrahydropterin synthase
MERWSIDVEKDYLKFSAAHFLIFPDGTAERLHGHNYRVHVEVQAALKRSGLVIDFTQVKPVIKEEVELLDEHLLIPGQHEELTFEQRADGIVEVRYRERYYAAPHQDVLILPINNTSAENLATYLGRQLRQRLAQRFPDVCVQRLRLSVEETAGQRGVYHYHDEAA